MHAPEITACVLHLMSLWQHRWPSQQNEGIKKQHDMMGKKYDMKSAVILLHQWL